MKEKTLSIVIPCYNERDHIQNLVSKVLEAPVSNKEIIMTAGEYTAKGLIWPLFSTAIFFLVFVGALTLLFGWFERRLDYFR